MSIKGRVTPAALVYGLYEGLLIHSALQETGLAFRNMQLDVKKPVVAGDTIHVECEITEVGASKTGNRGLARSLCKVVNQKREVVPTYTPLAPAGRPRPKPRTRRRRSCLFSTGVTDPVAADAMSKRKT